MTTQTKNALITGAGLRIGRATALHLAEAGWNIAIHYNSSKDAAQALAVEIRNLGRSATCVQANLEQPSETTEMFGAAYSALGPISCLINNASVFEPDKLADFTPADFQKHLTTNLLAPALLSQSMAAQSDLLYEGQGNIINIIDQRIFNLRPDFLSYTLSKSALWTLTQSTAMDLAPRIRVNAIGPGPTLSNKRQSPYHFKQQCESVPLGYGATPEEIAKAILFLMNTPSITGEFIALDGGQHLPTSTAIEEDINE
jgi:NAD(P)-dependent dehydrogenase (short-subunit alcohol dehydrogenase family)